MAWRVPEHSREEVDQAGRTLVAEGASREDRELALVVVNNWRSSHAFPLNTVQVNLRNVAQRFDADPTVAQRLKRLPSIETKLRRLTWLSLAEMQDLGGCRAVVDDVDEVKAIVDYYKQESQMRHALVREDDYIERPKRSGYRSVHLIYEYASDRSPTYNGLKIEMQLRSRLQHAWATAVETVGTFTGQALKSSVGEEAWLRFFIVMSGYIAVREETARVPATPDDPRELLDELRDLTATLNVVTRLRFYASAMQFISDPDLMPAAHPFLVLQLDTGEEASVLSWRPYASAAEASEVYDALERAARGVERRDVVLVRADSLDALRRAYPNYFADTDAFVDAVEDAIAR